MVAGVDADRGLQARLAMVVVLLALATVAFVALALELVTFTPGLAIAVLELPATVRVHSPQLAATLETTGTTLRELSVWRSPVVLPLTALFVLAQYAALSRHPRWAAGAPAGNEPPPALERTVRRLAQQADVPPPTVTVVPDDTPNCYTVGRRGAATVVVTAPLIDELTEDERTAVLAHEIAHVQNRDVSVMTLAVAPFAIARRVGVALDRVVYTLGTVVWVSATVGAAVVTVGLLLVLAVTWSASLWDWLAGWAPLPEPGSIAPGLVGDVTVPINGAVMGFVHVVSRGGAYVLLLALLGVPSLVALGAYYLTLGAVPRLLSVYREYAADRAGALLTGDPASLASALQTLDEADPRPDEDYRQISATPAICFRPMGLGVGQPAPIARYLLTERPWVRAAFERLPVTFPTHPDTEERVARLRSLVATTETAAED